MKKVSIIIILLAIFLASCSPRKTPFKQTDIPITPTLNATPTQGLPTNTPEPTPESMPTAGVYKDTKIMFTYPPEWQSTIFQSWIVVANKQDILDDPFSWTYGKGDVGVVVGVASLERQAAGNQIQTLDQYTLFSDMENPDKETAHMVTLNNKEFAIGTYSESYINSRNGATPLFTAMYFSKQSTITIEMYTSPDEETRLRRVFEEILASIEAIPVIKTSYALQPFEPMLIPDANELDSWFEPSNNQKVYSDGVCRWFEDNKNENRSLTTCTVGNSQYTNLATTRERYSSNYQDFFVDLESLAKYKYNHEFDLYAYQDDDGNPSFLLTLENHDLLHTIEIKIQPFQQSINFSSGVKEKFGDEIEDLLHDVATKMLEKSKYPFDPELLIPANGLINWNEPDFGFQFQRAYSDGICRWYDHEQVYTLPIPLNFFYNLDNCIFYKTDDYNLNSLKETFQNDGNFIDLQTKSKYTYDYDFFLYGYLSVSGRHPTYTLYLEKDGFLFNAEITILESQADIEAISELFNDEIDDTLHEVIVKNLEKFQ